MFFKKIETYSNNKLKLLSIIFHCIYFILLLIAPIIVISTKYQIFEHIPEQTRLTGIGLILFIIVGIYCYLKLKNSINGLPQTTLKEQKVKFSLLTITNILPLGLILLALAMTKNNIILAFETLQLCSIFILLANLIDGLFIRFLVAEKQIRNKTLEIIEVDKRKELLQK